ncbi:MAG: leucine-rich repeat protein, partial [Bacteroidaceae bacterium]|nr:leucine-rich repeat protein [Bacteroidaceae bacterium]
MKQLLLSIILASSIVSHGQNLVTIDGLQYAFKGTSAAVVNGCSYDEVSINGKRINYSDSSYTIPSHITYDGKTFTVDKICNSCFNDLRNSHRYSSKIKNIKLPETITTIGSGAFVGTNISSMVFPKSLQSFTGCAFGANDFLTTLIYTSRTAPEYWTAAPKTYVPVSGQYNRPSYTMEGFSIIEMISFSDFSFEYTGKSPTTTWRSNVEGYSASLSMPILRSEAGNHMEWIPVTFTNERDTFTADVAYCYWIEPAKLTAKVSNASREYGEDNPQFRISYSGFINGENESVITTQPTISTTATKESNVGEYPITISGGAATNYELVYEPSVLTITKAPLSAKVNDTAKVYGSQNPSFTMEYSGLKNDETVPAWSKTPTFQTEATRGSSVGRYDVNAVNGVPINYNLGEITAGSLTVTPAPLTIKANDAKKQYYSDNPDFG